MRKLVLAIAATSLLGCRGDSTGPVASAIGAWNLVTINGSPLPFTVAQVGTTYRREVLSDHIITNRNGTFVETFSYRETENGTVTSTTETDIGVWAQNNAVLNITHSDGTTIQAALSDNTLTISEDGFAFVYHRQ